jgi:predicted dehydrogenase
MKAGKHVFIEKPMAWTLEGADQIIEAEKVSGNSVFVGYMRRYATAFERAKEKLQTIDKSNIAYGPYTGSIYRKSTDPQFAFGMSLAR